MKKINIKLLSMLFAAFTMSATIVSCGSDDEKPNPETNNGASGTYNGTESYSQLNTWGVVNFAYSTMLDPNEKITISRVKTNIAGKVNEYDSLFFTSPIWGTGKFDLNTKTGTMTVSRRDQQTMEVIGDPIAYEATISKEENGKKYLIQIPGHMQGGTTITVQVSKMPTDLSENKTYHINSYVDNANNYFQPKSYATSGETMVIKTTPVFAIEYTSLSNPSWGTYLFNKLSVEVEGGSYTITGEGTATITNHQGNPKEYVANISATLKDGEITGEISIPGVMGGIIIHLNPEDFDTSLATAVENSYTVNSYVDNAYNYFQPKSYATSDETMVIVASNDFKGVNIQYESKSTPSWGTFEFKNTSVTKESGAYKIKGEGTALIASSRTGELKNYDASINATIKDGEITGEISIPSVMGGIIIHLNPEDFDTVVNSGN